MNEPGPTPVKPKVNKISVSKPTAIKLGVAVLVLAVVGLSSWSMYSAGYSKGKKDGSVAINNAKASANANRAALPTPVIGEITDVKDKIISVKQGKDTKTITIDDQTKITNRTGAAKAADIKKGARVAIFTTGNGSSLATRIILQ